MPRKKNSDPSQDSENILPFPPHPFSALGALKESFISLYTHKRFWALGFLGPFIFFGGYCLLLGFHSLFSFRECQENLSPKLGFIALCCGSVIYLWILGVKRFLCFKTPFSTWRFAGELLLYSLLALGPISVGFFLFFLGGILAIFILPPFLTFFQFYMLLVVMSFFACLSIFYFFIRFSLFPAALAENFCRPFRASWCLTKGFVWRILGVNLVIELCFQIFLHASLEGSFWLRDKDILWGESLGAFFYITFALMNWTLQILYFINVFKLLSQIKNIPMCSLCRNCGEN